MQFNQPVTVAHPTACTLTGHYSISLTDLSNVAKNLMYGWKRSEASWKALKSGNEGGKIQDKYERMQEENESSIYL